ncbi:MAG: hypothetical protein QME64_09460, partial [bacterium]|nr:hypothetical protein [bacterium]
QGSRLSIWGSDLSTMRNKKSLSPNLSGILIIVILALLGSYFFFLRNPDSRKAVSVNRRTGDKIYPDLSGITHSPIHPFTDSILPLELRVETSFDGTTVGSRTIFRGIGSRDIFTPLIPPPPPPKPRERGVHELTINWVLEEFVSPTEVIVTDTRRAPHTVTTGDEISGISLGRIEETANRVELIYKGETKWLVLQDIETVTRGWKLEGVSPDTGEAYIFIERSGGSRPLSEGTTFDHIRLEKVNDDGIVLRYGTQKRIIKIY